jgi:hypothetical protein
MCIAFLMEGITELSVEVNACSVAIKRVKSGSHRSICLIHCVGIGIE